MPYPISTNDRRVVRTKRKINEAFLQLLMEKAPSQITVKELAGLADINRKTFYMYYANMDDIMNELEDQLSEKLVLIFDQEIFQNSEFDAHSFFEHLNEAILSDIDLYRCMNRYNYLPHIINRAKDALISAFMKKYDIYSVADSERYILFGEYAASGILSMYTRWFSSEERIPLDEFTKIAAEITLHGLQNMIQ